MSKKVWLDDYKITLEVHDHDLIGTQIEFTKNFFEYNLLNNLERIMKFNKPNVIVDIGSNIGNHLTYWKLKHPDANFIAYEPTLINFNLLKNNLINNKLDKKNDEIINAGIFNKEIEKEIWINKENLGNSSIIKPNSDIENTVSEKIKLKDIYTESKKWQLDKEESIVLIKMDIEGAEQYFWDDILKIMKNSKAKVFFMIEIWTKNHIKKIKKNINDLNEIKYKCLFQHRDDFIFTNIESFKARKMFLIINRKIFYTIYDYILGFLSKLGLKKLISRSSLILKKFLYKKRDKKAK
ncbi:MAG: FkbM family methyltransferase [Mycoplasma sp.]|nr:FkbM family methyltransferase [Mycoplasma sp.]